MIQRRPVNRTPREPSVVGRAGRRAFFLAAALTTAVTGVWTASADASHDGETVTVTKSSGASATSPGSIDLADGDTVVVTFSGFRPGDPARVVVNGEYPLYGPPGRLNYSEFADTPLIEVGDDGTGTTTFTVKFDHGMAADGAPLNCTTDPCWITVVQPPFLPEPHYNSVKIQPAGSSTTPASSTPGDLPSTSEPAAGDGGTTTTVPDTATVPVESSGPSSTETSTTEPASTTTTDASIDRADDPTDVGDDSGAPWGFVALGGAIAAVLAATGFAIARQRREATADSSNGQNGVQVAPDDAPPDNSDDAPLG